MEAATVSRTGQILASAVSGPCPIWENGQCKQAEASETKHFPAFQGKSDRQITEAKEDFDSGNSGLTTCLLQINENRPRHVSKHQLGQFLGRYRNMQKPQLGGDLSDRSSSSTARTATPLSANTTTPDFLPYSPSMQSTGRIY